MQRICILPRVEGVGGVASFRLKLEAGLEARGYEVTHEPLDATGSILVLGGTRGLLPLWRAKRRGVRIVQRLDGINWVHRRRNTGPRHFVRAEYGNFMLSFIRRFLADRIVYQSEFARQWWEGWYGKTSVPSMVVHNGVDLNAYSVGWDAIPPYPPYKLLVVEGSLGGGYDMGLDNVIQLAEVLQSKHGFQIELMIVGKIDATHRAHADAQARAPIRWLGLVPRGQIPEIDRSAHLLFSADLNAACPNSVIEALACGLPVVGFDTGALNELVTGDAGRLVPYGGDVWRLERPDVASLAEAAAEVLKDPQRFRKAARARAESALGLDKMVEAYLSVLTE
jgi:glycosyltransferase involved in cell wall biosynthesis